MAVISILDIHVLNRCLGTLLEGTSSTSGGVSTSLVRIGQNEFGATLLNQLLTRGLSHVGSDDRPNHMEMDLETWYVQYKASWLHRLVQVSFDVV